MQTIKCKRCQKDKCSTEYFQSAATSGFLYCKECVYGHRRHREKMFKKMCLEHKGGKCQKCGYDKCPYALQFHHRDPKLKRFDIGAYRRHSIKGLLPEVIEELEKCDLLCANCHLETHYDEFIGSKIANIETLGK